jgi:glycosyltransferase involved in cell wall biosynthesis
MPRLSIITINYNNAPGLQKTMESVFAQSFTDYEYIIIDGGSTDGFKEIIEKHLDKLAYWVSEKDKGIYHAMNKGIEKAHGDYLLFLNSGDVFYDSILLKEMVPYLNNDGIVYGDIMIREPHKSWVKKYNAPLSFTYFTIDTLPHQGAFIYRELFKTTGLYDETAGLCADWKFFLEAVCRYGFNANYVNRVISIYDYSGVSSLEENREVLLKEKEVILKREWGYVQSLHDQLASVTHRYNLLSNSRVVKAYIGLRKKLGLQ